MGGMAAVCQSLCNVKAFEYKTLWRNINRITISSHAYLQLKDMLNKEMYLAIPPMTKYTDTTESQKMKWLWMK